MHGHEHDKGIKKKCSGDMARRFKAFMLLCNARIVCCSKRTDALKDVPAGWLGFL